MCSFHVAAIAIVTFCLYTAARSDSDLEFLIEPTSRFVKMSEGRGVFRCEASPPGAEIHWLYKGGSLPHNRFIKASGQKLTVLLGKMDNSTRSAHFFDFLNDAYFQCEIRFRGKALVSHPAKLIVAVLDDFPPQPHLHISAIAGNTAIIPCDPPHSIPTVVTEFSFNDIIIDKATGNKHIMPSGDLQIFDVKHEDSGEYMCIANNPYLSEKVKSQRKVILHVEDSPEFKPVSFIKSPRSKVSAALGVNLTLECAAAGYPIPSITWKRSGRKLSEDRYQQHGGNLHIINVKRGDEGTYTCEAEDATGNKVSKSCDLEIQETPQITKSPNNVVVEVGLNFSLNCQNRGHPKPSLKWIHNGKEIIDGRSKKGTQLTILNVHQRHGGIYQCLASNSLGTAIASATVTVTLGNSSLDFIGSDEYEGSEFGNGMSHSDREKSYGTNDQSSDDGKRNHNRDNSHIYDSGKRHHKRKHSKGVKLIPPSKPEINRLSNTSVMVRWTAGDGGLPINFFKLQYKEVGRGKTNWMTIDEDIAAHIHSYAVTNLRTEGAYRFRIAAVYSNSDNRDGPISDKFVLVKDTPMEKPSVIPIISFAEAVSPSAITLQWEYQDLDSIQTDGFFIHYRATHMAGKYLKVSVLGSNTRSHIISHLLPDTGYDIKMQSFNRAGTSDFSNIYTSKTKASEVTPTTRNRNSKPYYNDEVPSITESISSKNTDYNLLYIIVGVVILLSLLVVCVCIARFFRQRTSRPRSCDNSNGREEALKVGNGHVTSNGYISVGSKINININPMSHIDLDSAEKPEDLGDMVSNNNEIIRLQTFNINTGPQEEPLLTDIERERNNMNSEIDKITSVISPGSLEMTAELPEEV